MTELRVPTRLGTAPDGTLFFGFVVSTSKCRAVYTHERFISTNNTITGRRVSICKTSFVSDPSATVALFVDDRLLEEGWHLPSLAEGMLLQVLGKRKTPGMFENTSPKFFYSCEFLLPGILGIGSFAGLKRSEFVADLTDCIVSTITAVKHQSHPADSLRWANVANDYRGGVVCLTESPTNLQVLNAIPVRSVEISV